MNKILQLQRQQLRDDWVAEMISLYSGYAVVETRTGVEMRDRITNKVVLEEEYDPDPHYDQKY